VTFFAGDTPAAHVGASVGFYLIAWGIFTAYMFVASLRTNAAVATVFFLLAVTFFLLGIGNSGETKAWSKRAAGSAWRRRWRPGMHLLRRSSIRPSDGR
jgi:succinate-acetate transporter protein